MKIAVIGARGIPDVEGGAEKNAEMIFPIIARQHSVTLYAIRGYSKYSDYKGVKIVNSPKVYAFGTEKIVCYIYAAFCCLWKRPDVIHCQGLGSAILLFVYRLAARRVIVRYGSTDYKMAKWSWIGKLGFRLSEWQLQFADCVIAVAPSLKRDLIGRGYGVRIDVVPNAVDSEQYSPDDLQQVLSRHELRKGRYILGVGRLTAQKNFITLIRSFKLLCSNGRNKSETLVIVGGDDGSGYYQKLQKEADERIYFTGRISRKEVRMLLRGSGVYVNCSVHEGMSNAVLEAISAGCPVLLSDINENRDLAVASRHFFPVGCAASLARRLEQVSSRPGDFVVSTAAFSDWEEISARTIAVYESMFR